jgi:phosphoribosylglycinamide formyltransferase-1
MSTPRPPLRLAVLISGEGTTLEHLVQAVAGGRLHAEVVGVLCSRPGAGGIERARRHGIPVHVVSRRDAGSQRAFNDAVHEALDSLKPDLLVLAGFLSKLELRGFAGRAMNVHPALIPAFCGQGFYGARVHEQVLASGVKLSGATVHFCDDEYDTGPIILQQAVPVHDDDTPDTLAARVQAAERELYVRAIQLHAEGRLHIEGRRVRIRPSLAG